MLAWTIYLCWIGAIGLLLLPRQSAREARWLALSATVAAAALAVIGALGHAPDEGVMTVVQKPWIVPLGIEFHLAVDGISLALLLLTGVASIAGVLFSWNVTHRSTEFFALYLVLIGAVYGVFLSFDLFLLFAFYELVIVPKYLLIAIWGKGARAYAAMKLALYTFAGSALVLLGMVAVFVMAGADTMNLLVLAERPLPLEFQTWALPVMWIGFAVLAGVWPLHTWAPTGHVAAPTAASMLLAGVIMKLGAYGALRTSITLFPDALQVWQGPFGYLAAAGIVYAAGVSLVQRDFKYVIGYSSVSHMGFVLLGLVSLNGLGTAGAVLQMVSHGVLAGLLFAVVGRMVHDRVHTRDLEDLRGLNLRRQLPFVAVVFGLASLAAAGFPGFSGFVAELSVLSGSWRDLPVATILAGFGILLGMGYSLRAVNAAFLDISPVAVGPTKVLPSVTVPEKVGAAMLLGFSLWIGLYPQWMLGLITSSYQSPLWKVLIEKGGW